MFLKCLLVCFNVYALSAAYMSVPCACLVPTEAREDTESPGTRVSDVFLATLWKTYIKIFVTLLQNSVYDTKFYSCWCR